VKQIIVGQGYTPAGPTIAAFHRSNAFVRGVRGPVGSSKSSGCVMEIFTRAQEQAPFNGRRKTRWAILRRTYPELKSTTIKTWNEWIPQQAAPMKWDSPITAVFNQKLPDGTQMEMEVLFFPLDNPDDIDNLSSLELTGGWINEARELALPILEKLTERVGRYPKMSEGGPTYSGVIMDTNPPDTDSWWFKLAEGGDPELTEQMHKIEEKLREKGMLKEGQKLYEFFSQPGGLIQLPDGTFEDNPDAENINNLPGGYGYYYRIAAGKNKEFIKTQILGQYGTTIDGEPVYKEHYNDELHCRKVEPLKNVPIICGLDYGQTPAAAFCQLTPRGQFRIIDELQGWGMGVGGFAEDVLKPHIGARYRDFEIIFVGDPAGMAQESDQRSAFDVLASHGIVAIPAYTNKLTGRLEAVRHFLQRMPDGQPAFAVDPRCDTIRKGFIGKYHFARVKTASGKLKDVPDKDDYSHLQDAVQYAAMHAKMDSVNDSKFKQKIDYPAVGLV
jgi:hypothetical protein